MSTFAVRPATTDDLKTLLELEQGIILSERPYDPYLRENTVSYYDIPALINDVDSHLIVVESGRSIIGCGYAQIRHSKACHQHDQHCYLGFIYLEPEYRGNALGKLIMDTLQEWGISRGMKHFQLNVYSDNEYAIRAYEKAGYSKVSVLMELVR